MSEPTYLIVAAYQCGNKQRFWSGRRWVSDPSDAQTFCDFRSARHEHDKRVAFSAADLFIVENYGLEIERIALGGPIRRIGL